MWGVGCGGWGLGVGGWGLGVGCGVWGVGCGVWGFTSFEVANYLIFREKVPKFPPDHSHIQYFWLFGLCYAMDGGYKGCNPYIERHLAIFVNCF